MKKNILLLIAALNLLVSWNLKLFAQSEIPGSERHYKSSLDHLNKVLYAGSPNHREIVIKAFLLAESKGFLDTTGITRQQILDRLEAGAYSEDLESIPGIVGEHFPAPWNLGPDFDFYGYYPVSKIPYGSYLDPLSGWARGLYHGFDPVQGFHWPGTDMNTVEWANYYNNTFSWDRAVSLYQSGHKQEAYECLGHVLHLLADLSVPAHVCVVNHGISISSVHSGTIYDPDVLKLIVDEYELALAGGVAIPNVYDFIPDILDHFRNCLNLADPDSVPQLSSWDLYFYDLAGLTYYNNIVGQYFSPPDSEGAWGNYMDGNGQIVNPEQYFLTPPAEIVGRWAQISIQSTPTLQGTVFPKQQMEELCTELVPRAVEYSAGLILFFLNYVTGTEEINTPPSGIFLSQNYPNPFNPSTRIVYKISSLNFVELEIYDLLGREVEVLVNEEQPAGVYSVEFFADKIENRLSGGIYFYRLKAGDYQSVKKMIYLK